MNNEKSQYQTSLNIRELAVNVESEKSWTSQSAKELTVHPPPEHIQKKFSQVQTGKGEHYEALSCGLANGSAVIKDKSDVLSSTRDAAIDR